MKGHTIKQHDGMKVWTCKQMRVGWWIVDESEVIIAQELDEDDAKLICELHRIFQEFINADHIPSSCSELAIEALAHAMFDLDEG